MKRGKQIPQKVLWIEESDTLTRKGNPDHYWYILGCGHVKGEFHSIRTVIDQFMVLKGLYVEKNCHRCRHRNSPDDVPDEHFPFGMVRSVAGMAGQRMLDIHRESGLLIDRIPAEHIHSVNRTDKLYRHLYQTVVKEHHSGDLINEPITPFKHKYVYTWWELENGYAVGWNENPSRGWSFPIMRIKEEWDYE
jgi:hypothetical protein